MDRLRRIALALALVSASAVVAAGCGGKKTDVSNGIETYNERLSQQGIPAKLECPDEVDGHEGTEFECRLEAEQGDRTEKITMEVRKEGDDLIVIEKDEAALDRAIRTVAGQQGGQGQQGQGGGQAPGGQAPGGQAPDQGQGQAPDQAPAPEQGQGGQGQTP